MCKKKLGSRNEPKSWAPWVTKSMRCSTCCRGGACWVSQLSSKIGEADEGQYGKPPSGPTRLAHVQGPQHNSAPFVQGHFPFGFEDEGVPLALTGWPRVNRPKDGEPTTCDRFGMTTKWLTFSRVRNTLELKELGLSLAHM